MATDQTIAHLCGNIYRESDYAYNGFRLVEGGLIIDDKTSTKVGVFLSRLGEMAIVFEGSKEPLDWWLNFRVDLRRFGDYGRAHAGTIKSWSAVRGRLFDAVEKYTPDKLTICGHSRGGGEAVLAAIEMHGTAPTVRVVTFGAPRVGNRAFARQFRELVPDCTRYWLISDPVPFVPFLNWGYRQVHGGQVLFRLGTPHVIRSYISAVANRG